MEFQLLSQEDALTLIAEIGKDGKPFEISLGEDLCFGTDSQKWGNVGTIRLFPRRTKSTVHPNEVEEAYYDEFCAARFGGFEWQVPCEEVLRQNIINALGELDSDPQKDTGYKESIYKFFYQGLQDALRRTLLLLPVFDADAVSRMPLRRPMTVVSDTSAVHQGALDFVCRFLAPWARLKIPATVHMELVQNSDNYFKQIRWQKKAWKGTQVRSSTSPDAELKPNNKPKALYQHLLSQGGQRTLLRLEYDSDAEVERGDLGTDPLRSILTPAKDQQDSDLGMLDVVKSFGDRLIVETARQFRARVRPDHPLAILTSDQGMARMALAEGMDVFFFQARSVPQFTGRTLTGSLFHPFKPELYTVSLASVLWELAVSFGCLRLFNRESGTSLELWGIVGADEVTWQPLHAKEDLLWGKFTSGEQSLSVSVVTPSTVVEEISDQEEATVAELGVSTGAESGVAQSTELLTGAYKFSPNKMLEFIGYLVERGYLTDAEGQQLTKLTRRDFYRNYKNFLRSGHFAFINGEALVATDSLMRLWQVLVQEDAAGLLDCLMNVPSFKELYTFIRQQRMVKESSKDFPIADVAIPNYLRMGEAAAAWLTIPDIGIAITDQNDPELSVFAKAALESYEFLRTQEKTEWVLTGQWLEALVSRHSIHPIATRSLVAAAKTENLLQVYVEGSTPETRFDRHSMWMLQKVEEKPKLVKVFLYRGDFLIPGVSSVRIKIEPVNHAA